MPFYAFPSRPNGREVALRGRLHGAGPSLRLLARATALPAGKTAIGAALAQATRRLTHHQLDIGYRGFYLEKPLGHDTGSAEQINRQVAEVFSGNPIDRIDHYLGNKASSALISRDGYSWARGKLMDMPG